MDEREEGIGQETEHSGRAHHTLRDIYNYLVGAPGLKLPKAQKDSLRKAARLYVAKDGHLCRKVETGDVLCPLTQEEQSDNCAGITAHVRRCGWRTLITAQGATAKASLSTGYGRLCTGQGSSKRAKATFKNAQRVKREAAKRT